MYGLGGVHTHAHTHTHTFAYQKKPGRRTAGLKTNPFKNFLLYGSRKSLYACTLLTRQKRFSFKSGCVIQVAKCLKKDWFIVAHSFALPNCLFLFLLCGFLSATTKK